MKTRTGQLLQQQLEKAQGTTKTRRSQLLQQQLEKAQGTTKIASSAIWWTSTIGWRLKQEMSSYPTKQEAIERWHLTALLIAQWVSSHELRTRQTSVAVRCPAYS
jgi:hypothetical protein